MNIIPLEIKYEYRDAINTIYPVIIVAGERTILVDCGYAGFLPLIETAAAEHGVDLRQLTDVIVTHHDIDHVGGLFELKEKYPKVQVHASPKEAEMISGRKKSARLLQAEELFDRFPEEEKPMAARFQQMLAAIRPVAVDHKLVGDRYIPGLDGLCVVQTPGHTPGHICLYDEPGHILISGDAVVYVNGKLDLANPQYVMDLHAAVASVKKLARLSIETLICYHGGRVSGGIKEKLDAVVSSYGG